MRPLKGGLKANRAIVGTDARAVRPYIRMDNQLVNLFTLSTGQLKTGERYFLTLFGPDHVPCPYRIAVVHSIARGCRRQEATPGNDANKNATPPFGGFALPRTTRRQNSFTVSETLMLKNR